MTLQSIRRAFIGPCSIAACLVASLARAEPGDRTEALPPADGIRVVLNTPAADASRPTTLVVFACPNGNSAEQTLGGRMSPGVDWHYDIQHVLAQVRVVRERDRTRNVLLAVLEADARSWPAWRARRGAAGDATIRASVDALARRANADDVVLMAHSGGGSALFGYLNGGDAIPAAVSRVVFLDANYAFDADRHGPKLRAWLDGDARRQLVVVAYDDRAVEVNGKRVLSAPDKGTYGASARMREWFHANGRQLVDGRRDAFDVATDAAAQVRVVARENPENVIWHTRLVGDLNGVIYGLSVGADPDAWLAGPRVYEAMIGEPLPSTRPATPSATTSAATRATTAPSFSIPPRPAGARGGGAIMAEVAALAPTEREATLRRELLAGNVPAFLRTPCRVEVTGPGGLRGAVWAMPDYLAVGSDDDWVRVPITPMTGQAVADAFGAALPTRKLVDDVWRAADLRHEPTPLVPANEKGADAVPERQRVDGRETVAAFVRSHELIESQRAGRLLGALVAGAKKDVVVSNRLREKPGRVAIYGWHRADGKPIQPVTIVHGAAYVDYSHGVRLIARQMTAGDRSADLATVMADPATCTLVSDEGPIVAGYPAREP